jgi:tetratricopeptide (TPR) repeat protein
MMSGKRATSKVTQEVIAPTLRLSQAAWRWLCLTLVVSILIVVGGSIAVRELRVSRHARAVRSAIETRHFTAAEGPLQQWLKMSPSSAEAHYYRARLALGTNRPQQALQATEDALKLGYESTALKCLSAVLMARSGQSTGVESVLRQAFVEGREPQVEIARELAAIYLTTFQFERAAVAIERWRKLAPEDPEPYLWRNEIDSRTAPEPAILIQNYRAALERDPGLGKARLGLAEQLRKAQRLDEAEREYATHLAKNPRDADALIGMARTAFGRGDIDAAVHSFEAALAVNPREPEALKELAQIDLRRGDFSGSCNRLRRAIEIDPYDPDTRYNYAQALKFMGDEEQSQAEAEVSVRLRKEHQRMSDIRDNLLKTPNDQKLRFDAAQWLLEHGHDDEGLAWTVQILEAQPNHGPTHRLLADYYQRKGNAGLANYHRSVVAAGQGD